MERIAAVAAALGLPLPRHRDRPRASRTSCTNARRCGRPGCRPRAPSDIPEGADRETVQRLGRSIDYPAVLKPRRASGSWHTFPVASVDALGELWDELAAEEPEAFLLEEYLPDGPPMPGGFEAGLRLGRERSSSAGA